MAEVSRTDHEREMNAHVMCASCTRTSVGATRSKGDQMLATAMLVTATLAAPPILPLPVAQQFAARVDNPWFPLRPGTVLTYRGQKDGVPAVDVVRVTGRTRVVAGARA